jgi:hypothetical protein
MNRRAEYICKMALGWMCYRIVMIRYTDNGFVLGWAGFYAFDDGFEGERP